ncbi:unnamed protein product [Rhizoctonia solani]|uniref:Myb-like domain-containing protein n=1 Tax=Rhizoctonia solani TaxID=456999 RepID=A0A8H2WJ30_9AGAM|nr:unnamed protein product [Rhizoctonia solani]
MCYDTSNIDNSIAELEKFIQTQRSTLGEIQQGTRSLEELKRWAVAEPEAVLRDIIAGRHNTLKFSSAALGLAVNAPEIDWTLLEADDLKPVIPTRPPETGSSRVDEMRSHISNFRQVLAQLPPLPTELLDDDRDTEERGKKRRRVDSTCRVPVTPASSSLRLPQLADSYDNIRSQPSPLVRIPQFPEVPRQSTSSSGTTSSRNPTKLPNAMPQLYKDPLNSRQTKEGSDDTPIPHESPSPISPTTQGTPPTPIQPVEASVTFAMEESTELLDAGESQSTFKQSWSLAEQHTLERLLVEIPSTVKFRWVRISEAMGGTRTPRQVASRVQKYYEKMKKLGVTVNSAEMGGGGRGGSKATQNLDTPPSMRTRGPSTRGKPKTGPQYTKSGRRR